MVGGSEFWEISWQETTVIAGINHSPRGMLVLAIQTVIFPLTLHPGIYRICLLMYSPHIVFRLVFRFLNISHYLLMVFGAT